MAHDQNPPEDPLDLEAVDRAIRINELTEQARELGMGESFVDGDCPPEIHEQFLKNIVDYESAPVSSHFAQLEQAGVALPPPDSLDDAALHAKLWEVINVLAKMSVSLSRTDHLSDRELYTELWGDTLREDTAIMAPGSGWMCHLDMLGGCSEEDIENSLRYYDSEEDRQQWAKEWPDDVIPPHVDPPFDRDRHLPKVEQNVPECRDNGLDEFDDGDESDEEN